MGLCITDWVVPNEQDKKTGLTSFRLSPEFREAAEHLAKLHTVPNLSQYWRGLIYLDAMLTTGETDMLDKPAWVTRDYGELIRVAARAKESPSVERQTQIARKTYEQHGESESQSQSKRHRSKTA